jgi:hypothetical protein
MQYVFVNGKVAIMIQYCEEHYGEVDAGARIDLRRVEQYEGAVKREGIEGYRILPVSEGGIWRIDLSTRIDSERPEQRYHHHPNFRDGDVGPREFDPELSADAFGWIERRLLDLPDILTRKGFADIGATVDVDRLGKDMPMIRAAIEASLAA